jgi:hypothetical protein
MAGAETRRDEIDPEAEAALIGALAETESEPVRHALMRRMMATGRRVTSLGGLTARVTRLAPELRVNERRELFRRHPGRTEDEVADLLIGKAARAAAGVGATTGAAAFLPFPVAWPVQLATETLVVIGIELKLVAELHEVYGVGVPGPPSERALAYLGAWSRQRGATVTSADATLAAGSALNKRLRRRIAMRTGRDVVSLGPLLSGAALGAAVNHHETARLGKRIKKDLRRRG